MKKYREYKEFSYPEIEKEILAFWEENQIFEKSISTREGNPAFTFYEGPPSANGMPGIHHVMARTIKDIFCRYKTLQGFQVKRKAGWDTHGLPVELQVEKELGITKDDIGVKISIEEYNQKCRETVMRFTNKWEELTEKMGYWVDMENAYVTYHNEYIESVWWLLKQLYDKNLLYKGYTIQPYSPKAGTGLSSHELNLPGCYRDVTDTSITAQFKIIPSPLTPKGGTNNTPSLFTPPLGAGGLDLYILAWTTTPWTLPSNCALAVGEKIDYQFIQTFNPYTFEPICVILAKDLVKNYFNEKAKDIKLEDYKAGDKLIPYQILGECKGKDLVGLHYEQLMPYITNENLQKNAFRVIAGDFVTTADGTGVVHTASVFGADDFRVAQANNVPAVMVKDEEDKDVPLVNKQGQFVQELKDGMNVDLRQIALKHNKKENEYDLPKYMKAEYEEGTLPEGYYASDVLISILLKEQNKAFKVEKYVHSYPHCWRTDKPILYYPLDSWFIRTTAMKDKLVALNKTINWKPESTGTGRFGNWLENLVDWNLSRQRYWGIPLPVWRTEDGKEDKCVGSVYELTEEIEKSIKAGLMKNNPLGNFENRVNMEWHDEDGKNHSKFSHNEYTFKEFDLHRPHVDNITLVSNSGKPMFREADLIDVWFDSGAMPYAQQHFPFKDDSFGKGGVSFFPADFISEAVDQTRGWFFTLHAIAGMLFDSVAFKNVISTGLLLDKEGRKMSKRLGNAVDPFETLDKYGADATRWYMVQSTQVGENVKFDVVGIEEILRRFFGTLKNTYSFFALYANLDNFRFEQAEIPLANRTESDRWIISKLNSLVQKVSEALDDYEPTKATRLIQDFTNDDLSNWYVRLNRKRFWKSDYNTDKIAAYQTLYTCLETIAKLASPIMPFYTERIFLDLNEVSGKDKNESIHLAEFPKVNLEAIDADLEQKMDLAQLISSLAHSLRKKANIRVRQPLQKILIPILDNKIKEQISAVADLIENEVNVKQVEFLTDDSGIVIKSVKPNFKTLGAKYKQQMKEVAAIIQNFTKEDIALVEQDGKLMRDGFEILLEDVLISSQDVQGLSVASENGLTVALDVTITEELLKEGFARDFVNRIQNLRKDSGLEVQDKIQVSVQANHPFIEDSLNVFKEYVCTEIQAINLDFAKELADAELFEIEEYKFGVKIEVLR